MGCKMQMVIGLLLSILPIVTIYNNMTFFNRHYNRYNYYQRALVQSVETNKPLLVIGDPYTGYIVTRNIPIMYGCGDVCLDLSGCGRCPNETVKLKGDLLEILPTLVMNSYVIYSSYTLEYVPNIKRAIAEIRRVSGGDMYIVHSGVYICNYNDTTGRMEQQHMIVSAPPETFDFVFYSLYTV